MVLRGTCQWDTFDSVEAVLENRYMRLREEFHMERLLRLHSESEFRKREEIVEKEKIIHGSYEALLKEVKEVGLADPKTIEELQKKNSELELEVENLKERCVDGRNELDVLKHEILDLKKLKRKWFDDRNALDKLRRKVGILKDEKNDLAKIKSENSELKESVTKYLATISELRKENRKLADGNNEIDVLRRKNGELESEILELRKLNEKMVEDNNELVVLREMIGKLEHEVLELRKSKKKRSDDSNAHDEVRSKVHVIEGDENDLAELKIETGELKETMKKNLETISELRKENDKRTFEILLGSFNKKFRGLTGRVSRLEDDTNFDENEDVCDNEFRTDIIEEAAPLQTN